MLAAAEAGDERELMQAMLVSLVRDLGSAVVREKSAIASRVLDICDRLERFQPIAEPDPLDALLARRAARDAAARARVEAAEAAAVVAASAPPPPPASLRKSRTRQSPASTHDSATDKENTQ